MTNYFSDSLLDITPTSCSYNGDISLCTLIMSIFHHPNDNIIINKIKLFLSVSSGLNTKDKFTGSTAMHYLMMLLKEKQRQLVDIVPYFKLLLDCIRLDGDMSILNYAKLRPIDIFNEIMNIVDNDGNNLLFHFVINAKYDIAMLAIELGVDINRQNNKNNTVFHYALQNAIKDFNNIQHVYFIDMLHRRFPSNQRGIMMSSIEHVDLMNCFEMETKMNL